MSEEMLSFMGSIMHNTPAFWTKQSVVYHEEQSQSQVGLDVSTRRARMEEERGKRKDDGGVVAGRVDYQEGFCKDERRVCVSFYGIRWSALILSPRVRSRHDPPPRPYICIPPLNSRAPRKTHRADGERKERGRERETPERKTRLPK